MPQYDFKHQVLIEAAQLIVVGKESDPIRARVRATRRLSKRRVKPGMLPTAAEIRSHVQRMIWARMAPEFSVENDDAAWNEDHTHMAAESGEVDRFLVYWQLLVPLEAISENGKRHQEADLLSHRLAIYQTVCQMAPYDEELQLAALLSDVGYAIDPVLPIDAALVALEGYITERTAWLIEHQQEGWDLREGELGQRASRRLKQQEWFEDLELLIDAERNPAAEIDQRPDLNDALAQLRLLAEQLESDTGYVE